jgi:hypothetical protein
MVSGEAELGCPSHSAGVPMQATSVGGDIRWRREVRGMGTIPASVHNARIIRYGGIKLRCEIILKEVNGGHRFTGDHTELRTQTMTNGLGITAVIAAGNSGEQRDAP